MLPFRIVAIRPVHEGWGRFMTAKVVLPDGEAADRQIEDHGTCWKPWRADWKAMHQPATRRGGRPWRRAGLNSVPWSTS